MNAITGERTHVAHPRFLQWSQSSAKGRILVDEQALFLFGDLAQSPIVKRQGKILGRSEILLDHGGGEKGNPDLVGLRAAHHLNHFFAKERQRHCGEIGTVALFGQKTMPDVIDADADGHPVRLVVEDVALKTLRHIGRLVAADAGVDEIDMALGIEHSQCFAHEVDVAGRAFAQFGDAVAQGDDHIPILQE
ncbi:MAG: hypothetical protein BWY77_01774 [bacterium ADurb.Bin431]|nr:MAG: hypothetical protein BWY77_01774 [bacterium ADurb.Bin431]